MRRSDRGASPIPFIIFLLLWLGSCYAVYVWQEKHEKAYKLNQRKKISQLRLGETVVSIKETNARLETEIKELKAVLGFDADPTSGAAKYQVSTAITLDTDTMVKHAKTKLDLYHDNTMPGSEGSFLSKKGEKDVELKINGNWVAVPLMGEAVKVDKLKDKQYRLNLQSVMIVLQTLHDRLARYKKLLEDNIARAEDKLAKKQAEKNTRVNELQQAISAAEAQLSSLQGDKTKVESEYDAKINAAEEERSSLEREAAAIEEQYKEAIRDGKKQIQTYRNKIQEANRQKANLREKIASARGGDRKTGVRSAADLIRETIETDQPDGEVAYSTPDGVFLDIGRADKVKPGLKFFVYAQAPGGGWTYRGKIEVYKIIQDHIAQARILDLKDRFSPLTKGDKIFNKIFRTPAESFSKGPTRLTFMGEFPRHSTNMKYVKSQLRRFGVDVQDKLTHWTEIVVVDRKYEQLEEYVRATRDLNVEVMTMDQLKEFIHY